MVVAGGTGNPTRSTDPDNPARQLYENARQSATIDWRRNHKKGLSMGLGDGLKKLRGKLGDTVAGALDRTLGDQPDSAAGANGDRPRKPGTFSLLDLDQITAGFPRELRDQQDDASESVD